MSIFTTEIINVINALFLEITASNQNICESIGITVKEPVSQLLVQEMEYRLREIIHVVIIKVNT
jgi:hypothetical protein